MGRSVCGAARAVLAWVCGVAAATTAVSRPAGDAAAPGASAGVGAAIRWIVASGDAAGRPFAVVDKKGARLVVFGADGRLAGSAPALLGLARGDTPMPGAGVRAASGIPPWQRTTPAGRFDAEPGRNHVGEAVVWFDYAEALAIHRLRPAHPAERRPQRLASPTPDDNRISLGCVIVDPTFYDAVVAPTLGRGRSVVYVLPESGDWSAMRRVSEAAAGL